MQGQLSQKPITKVIRQLSERKANGLLRVTRNKTIKAIFFEGGNPIFAISNVAQEQIEYKLLQENLVKSDDLEHARAEIDKPNQLSAKLIEKGVITTEVLHRAIRELIKSIILSLFDWEQGDFVFDGKMRAAHEVKLEITAMEILLEGARLAATSQKNSKVSLPPDTIVGRAVVTQALLDSGKLLPVESYVFSRIDSPISISEVGALSGLPDSEAQKAVSVLVAGGFLKLLNDDSDDEALVTEADLNLDRLKDEVERRTFFYTNADFYEILEITRQSTSAEIKAAYYNLAKKFHPDRYRNLQNTELRNKIESMFASITQAYETLSENGPRAAYDNKLLKDSKTGVGTRTAIPMATPMPTALKPPVNPSSPLKPPPSIDPLPLNSGVLPSPGQPQTPVIPEKPAVKPPVYSSKPASASTTSDAQVKEGNNQSAERFYQQGRARIEHKDYSGAIPLLREAVKLEPKKSHYHFYLGSALIRSPRNRREAEDHLSKAAKLDQFNTKLKLKIAMLFKEIGNQPKADVYFKDALSLDPDNPVAKKELRMDTKSKTSGVPIWKQDVGSIAKRIFKRG
ncbi:MAG: DUF4388 domain-containing protein [Acidobacteriota bacterium]